MTRSARAHINLGAIQHNLNIIRAIDPAAQVMAVIKGNAYGHGMLETAAALPDVDAFAVARIAEAAELRRAGCTRPLVLLGGVIAESDLDIAARLDVALCVHNNEQLDWLAKFTGGKFDVWVKVDTGMHRLGFNVKESGAVINQLRACSAVGKLSLMTHFANADDPQDEMTERQIVQFAELAETFDGDISVANSGGLMAFAENLKRLATTSREGRIWIRPGIALFGVSPIMGCVAAELGLRPAMTFESILIAVKKIRTGQPVGYGGEWRAPNDTVIGVVAVGYGDGYGRYLPTGTPMLINGREVGVVGAISMDLTSVDLGPNAQDQVGDRVLLWGDALPVERVADIAKTAAYQLITGVIHREAASFEN